MTYDKDLKIRRRICIGLWWLNCTLGALNALTHHWVIAATCVAWAATSHWDTHLVRAQQCFRDHVRVAQAGLRAIDEMRQRR